MVQVQNIFRGKPIGINLQQLEQTVAVRLDKEDSPENYVLRLYSKDPLWPDLQVPEDAEAREYFASSTDSKTCYLHFRLWDLEFSETYISEIWGRAAEGEPYVQLSTHRIITPPANDSDQALIFAAVGDQENELQGNILDPFIRRIDGDNMTHTKLLYEHMGQFGNKAAFARDKNRGYDFLLHLGDLLHGEYILNLMNIFRRGEKVFTFNVETLEDFRKHLIKDFGDVVGLNLANMTITNLIDDHDIGGNGRAAVETASEAEVQKAVERAFHELILHPEFLKDNKKGPYEVLRWGNIELFKLHMRYTQEPNSPGARLLGEEQWAWLEAEVAKSDAKVKIIACPLPLVMGKKPSEDLRGDLAEWTRFLLFCRDNQIGMIVTGDSHNCSVTEVHVRERENDIPWKIMQYLIGTGGGKSQSISKKERKVLDKTQSPLFPKGADAELYRGSKVLFYCAPEKKKVYLNDSETEPGWKEIEGWRKGAHGYGSFKISPAKEKAKFTFFSCKQDVVEPCMLIIDGKIGACQP